jgi:hypothetical protein
VRGRGEGAVRRAVRAALAGRRSRAVPPPRPAASGGGGPGTGQLRLAPSRGLAQPRPAWAGRRAGRRGEGAERVPVHAPLALAPLGHCAPSSAPPPHTHRHTPGGQRCCIPARASTAPPGCEPNRPARPRPARPPAPPQVGIDACSSDSIGTPSALTLIGHDVLVVGEAGGGHTNPAVWGYSVSSANMVSTPAPGPRPRSCGGRPRCRPLRSSRRGCQPLCAPRKHAAAAVGGSSAAACAPQSSRARLALPCPPARCAARWAPRGP